jgi:transglutaminase-like putative cysteine protease
MGSWFFSKNYVRRAMSALWQVPRALGMVLLTALVCTSYIALSGNEAFEMYAGRSPLFRVIEEKAIAPLVQTETVQKIPETIDDVALRLARSLSEEGRRRFITVFINGETVGNAVRASPAINNTAIDIVRGSVDRLERARAVAAFSERSGICFDIASLYAAMCRAVHVPVRLITGEAVGAGGWVSHAWNEVYDAENHRWVPVDATFGLAGKNYFDSDTFHLDHRNPEIQGQWPEDMP